MRYARTLEHTSVCIVCMCKNVDCICSYLDVCRFVCTLHILCVQWIVCVWQLLAATCESGVLRLASLLQRPPRVDALERERTRECSTDESEATPHGPLGIYYNQ